MRQAKGEDKPLLQAEGDAQPAADAPADDATPMEEEKSTTGEEPAVVAAAAADASAADTVVGPSSPEGAGADEEGDDGEGRGGDPAVDAVGNADKLENGDGPAKADGDGSEVENKGVDGQNQPLLVPPAEDDLELAKVSNNFFSGYSTGGDDSGTEEEQAAFMKELERFYREKMMEFKPPKFYGEGLNCLK
jgi:hypothetical protein